MAYTNGINGSGYTNSSSIYKNRNVFTGLATGLDTESMIENAISGYKAKLERMTQDRTRVEWKQQQYRDIITKMAGFSDQYTSYASSNNLMSPSFFDSALNIESVGASKDQVSASGRTDSEVEILGVKALATSSRYTLSGLGGSQVLSGETVNLEDKISQSNISGSLTLKYGSQNLELKFDKDKIIENGADLAAEINKQLAKMEISFSGGGSKKASEVIEATFADNKLTFTDKSTTKNSLYISDASGDLKKNLVSDLPADTKDRESFHTITFTPDTKLVDDSVKTLDYLVGKTFTMTLNGVSKDITIEAPKEGEKNVPGSIRESIEKQAIAAFGADQIKVDRVPGHELSLQFKLLEPGSTLILEEKGENTGVLKALGFENDTSSFVDTTRSLGEIYHGKNIFGGLDQARAVGEVTEHKGKDGAASTFTDSEGYKVVDKGGQYFRVDDEGKALYDLTINGKTVGSFNEKTEMRTVMNKINNNEEAGVKVSYSRLTDQFTFTARESGAKGNIEFGNDLGGKLFGQVAGTTQNTTKGTDASFAVRINGQEMDLTRSSNSIDIDGLNVRLNGTFGYDEQGHRVGDTEAVTFKTTPDTDKVVNAVKDMVKDFNELMTGLKESFSTLPNTRSNGKPYDPLTEKDRKDMSESAVKDYEEKAKQGLLFGDRELSSLYNDLVQAVTPEGKAGADLRAIGITTEYKNGLTTLKLDENVLKQAVEATPDKVKNVFSRSKENGSESDGLLRSIQKPLQMYGSVIGTKGILVEKAGTPLAPTSVISNDMQKEIERINLQMSQIEVKMNSQVDYYTRQFTKLEQLTAQMNSQSSALMGLMMGG